jgi:hypothetical protein
MTRILTLLLPVLLHLAAGTAAANAADSPPADEQALSAPSDEPAHERAPRSELELGLDVRRFDYAELVTPPLKSTEKGTFPALLLIYRRDLGRDPFFFQARVDVSSPSTTYDGSTQSGTPVTGKTSNSFTHLEALAGTRQGPFEFYLGIAMTEWRRGDGKPVGGVISVREDYSWFDLPLGARTHAMLGENLSIGADLSLRPMVAGSMVVRLGETFADGQDSTATLGNRLGWRASLPIRYRTSASAAVVMTPWYQASSIGQSNHFDLMTSSGSAGTAYEPDSRTRQFGAMLGVALTL